MLKLIRFAGSSVVERPNFPVKFGRRDPAPVLNSRAEAYTISMFGADTLSGFVTAYRNVIGAFEDRDLAFLKKNLEPSLMRGIVIPDTQVVNEDSPVQVTVVDCAHILGAPFDRSAKSGDAVKQVMSTPICDMHLYMSRTNPRLSPLFRARVELKSSNKLVLKGQPRDSADETHLFQFEVVPESEESIDFLTMGNILQTIRKGSGLNPQDFATVVKSLFGKKYEWKISDIDGYLKGNEWA